MNKEEKEDQLKVNSIQNINEKDKSHKGILQNDNTHGNRNTGKRNIRSILLALLPLVILAGMIYFLLSPYSQNIINSGIPLPEVTIEKIEFHDMHIIAFIRNTGPEQITISQADVNDRIHTSAIEPSKTLSRLSEAKVIIPFLWNPAEPYEIGITTSDGTRFSRTIEAAAPAPSPNAHQASIFAVLGIYVGVIPVLIGLAWYPFMRKLSVNQYNFFLSLTGGLLVFLGIDALIESNEIVVNSLATTFNAQMLIFIVSTSTFLVLLILSEYFIKRAEKGSYKKHSTISSLTPATAHKEPEISSKKTAHIVADQMQLQGQQQFIKPLAISMMVAVGIGLHNFGEGLAIGAAVLLGEVALSTFLIVGFTLHNTTEGLAIVAPLAKTGKLMIKRLILLGLIAGIPTIIGTWIGGFIYSPLAAIIFLSVGAGAIFQVVYSLASWMRHTLNHLNEENHRNGSVAKDITSSNLTLSSASIIAGFIVGMLIMYITGLLI